MCHRGNYVRDDYDAETDDVAVGKHAADDSGTEEGRCGVGCDVWWHACTWCDVWRGVVARCMWCDVWRGVVARMHVIAIAPRRVCVCLGWGHVTVHVTDVGGYVCMCVHACVCVCVRACVRVCVCAQLN